MTSTAAPDTDHLDRLRAKLAELDAAAAAAQADAETLRAAEERGRVAILTDDTPAAQTAWAKAHRALETARARAAEAARDRDLLTVAVQREEHAQELAQRAAIAAENERRRQARAGARTVIEAELAKLAPTVRRFAALALAHAAAQGIDVRDVPLLVSEWLAGTRHFTTMSGPNPALAAARAEADAMLVRLENGEAP